MKRSTKGLAFDAALKLWADPDIYRAWENHRNSPDGFRIKGASSHLEQVQALREKIENQLFDLLRRGGLFSSATGSADPSSPRVLIPPSDYAKAWVAYDPRQNAITTPDTTFFNIEIFDAHRIPLNVEDLSAWEQLQDSGDPEHKAGGQAAFRHSPDYLHVWLRDQVFLLTFTQAQIVRTLDEARLRGAPWLHREEIREEVGFSSAKLSQLFRRLPNWRDLIRSDQRGYYALNI